ncbi:MAG: hypothetical protein KGL53_16655, partial [Elusimicrobia bacterium]|nr:hypothetical protein [Elusimicrobiota bacterium]
MPDSLSERLLRQYEQGERAALEALLRALDETEARLSEESARAPEVLRTQLEDLGRRLHQAKEETERRAEAFREELLSVDPSPDAFRARLVMLELEHASRMRLAEEGLKLLGERTEDALEAARARVKAVCDEVRQGLTLRVQPERLRLVESLAEATRRLAASETALHAAREAAEADRLGAEERIEAAESEAESARTAAREAASSAAAAVQGLAAA